MAIGSELGTIIMNTKELRQKYLDFFKDNGHTIISSASLIPENDPTTLFISSGMQPLIPYLLGEKHAEGTRVIDSQKCFRTVDIDEVGDNRHTTFFEMLGNWSFGDYFKKEQIPWYFEFVTKVIGLDPNRLYITCFKGNKDLNLPKDEESVKIWQEEFTKIGIDTEVVENPEKDGMGNGKIFYYDESKNWWSRVGVPQNMPVGEPGGPDSEVFWDFGEQLGFHEKSEWKNKPCHVNCDCGRFMEIGNNVFMEYQKTEKGFELLSQKNVDFGGGLERTLAAVLDTPDVFMIDVMKPVIKTIEKVSHKKYGENEDSDKAFRVITDHLRAATFLIADGAPPSNKDQGYYTRRLLRRSICYANKLGIKKDFCVEVVKSIIDSYKDHYVELQNKKRQILSEIKSEEEQFRTTLEKGLKEFKKALADKKISGKEAFNLFATYGFPLEMTQELAAEGGFEVDVKEFEKEFAKHQDISRKGAQGKFKGGLADASEKTKKLHTATHLLQAALRKVLGNHVEQKGSNITAERLRFDFSHPEKMTDEQKHDVEDLVNTIIKKDYPVTCQELSIKEAKEKGAIGLFEDKYGEKVKVYTVGDPNQKPNADPDSPTFSMEICGGPHVDRTGVLGKFKIKKEEASSAGIRRIKAVLE